MDKGHSGKKNGAVKPDKVFAPLPKRSQPPQTNSGRPAAGLSGPLRQAQAFQRDGNVAEAERLCRAMLAENPNHFEALHLLGMCTYAQGKLAEACTLIGNALKINSQSAAAHSNLGLVLQALGRHDEALASNDNALAIRPDFLKALFNRGNLLLALNSPAEALACIDKILALRPDYPEAQCNRGNALLALNRSADALASFDRALALRPEYADALNNRGNALKNLNRLEDAVASYDKALAITPDSVEAHYNRGSVLCTLERHHEAIVSFEKVLAIRPASRYALGMLADCRARICDWSAHADLARRLADGVRAGELCTTPFLFLGVSDDPADQLACAAAYVRARHPAARSPLWKGERYAHPRIRVAYLSGDFREHPLAWLIAGLIEQHDRAGFEITGISFGPDRQSATRTRLMKGFEHFIDVQSSSDADVAAMLRQSEIDIAVNLAGHTKNARTGLFARRPAPVQVNYLGYPATMGAEYIDYLIADTFVIPQQRQIHYREKIATLPDCYQANDTKRRIAEHTPTRAKAGLPEQGFVFCCFNNTFKLTPALFDIWMRLLQKTGNSVLWLLDSNTTTAANLRREAQARDVAPQRLVFAARVKLEDYLARYRLADLFLDTLPYNAHTTASDALWAGLPVLTCAGNAFAGRVAGSLLHAIGLPELVTYTLEDYEALALKLATNPAALREVREKLAANRLSAPLFDTDRFRRHIEAAYRTMWEIYQRGESPRSFAVAPVVY